MTSLLKLSDDDLRYLIGRAVRILERADRLNAKERQIAERRHALYISEAIRRGRMRMDKEP